MEWSYNPRGKIVKQSTRGTINKQPHKNTDYTNLIYKCSNKNCIEPWHRRLGHRNYQSIKNITSKQLANGIKIDNCKHDTICETWIRAKPMTRPIQNWPNTKPQKCFNRSIQTSVSQWKHVLSAEKAILSRSLMITPDSA